MKEFLRTEMLLGKANMEKLKNMHVAVFGLGGVGSYAAEALVRCGVGELTIVDNDSVSVTNINRQLFALHSSVGKLKINVAKERFYDINPDIKINAFPIFFSNETAETLNFEKFDYVIDAIDTVSSKLLLIKTCSEKNIKIISCMGTGNKLDPSGFKICDIFKTSVCPLARVMRREVKNLGIKKLKVLYSDSEILKPFEDCEYETKGTSNRPAPGSISFVPPVAGFMISGEVIRDLL